MTPARVRAALYAARIVAVLRERDAGACLAKARALAAGGLQALEVTWTTPGAAGVVRALARIRGALPGAGSILGVAQAREAAAAGARFLVSPVAVAAVAAWARRHGVLYAGGALTPSEVAAAWSAGIRPVKVFPCSALGGPAYLRALLAPMPQLELFPTGGVTLDNWRAHLDAGARLVGIGDALTNAPNVRSLAARLRREASRA
jgi:2-dehydro-3-deoxyphosphogluconate aldolase/(4S)-4-hydroxy-2-oxoglutarate aldolase